MILDKYKNFCVMPWIQFYREPDGRTKICCVTPTVIPSDPNSGVSDILRSSYHNNIRKKMLDDKPVQDCIGCIEREKYGESFRTNYNRGFFIQKYENYILNNTNDDGSLKEIHIRNLDIRFSNKCNFKCRMCGGQYSSAWELENNSPVAQKNSITDIKKWFNENLKYLKEITFLYIAGGEPLIQDQHYEFLELCIANKLNPRLFYQSNGSVLKYKEWDIFDLWKDFSDVAYNLSIDGLGKMGEYIRTGFKENIILKNIQKVKDSGVAEISYINIAVQAYNVFYLIELIDELFEKNIIDKFEQILFSLVMEDRCNQPKVLPEHLKIIAIDKIKKSIYYKQHYTVLDPIIKNLEDKRSQKSWDKFCRVTKGLDGLRNTCITDYFPEINIYE